MTATEAIEVLKDMLGEDDREDEAIDEAICALEFLYKTQKKQRVKQRIKFILERVKITS